MPAADPRPAHVPFGRPALYRLKQFVIEVVIWRVVLSGLFRLHPRPMPSLRETFVGRRVLVAACGPGHVFTGPPVEGADEVVAFDLSPHFAAACAQHQPQWHVYVGDVLRIPHPDKHFDVSVLYSALHHIPADAALVLAELARVTRDHVVLVEGIVPPTGLLRRALLLWYRFVDGGHHYYTREELDGCFQQLGLRPESAQLYSPLRHMLLAVLNP